MAEGYYYTLSAIAQSFAAIVSLYAIFVIYKLQVLRNHRKSLIEKLRKLWLKEIKRNRRKSELYESDKEFVDEICERNLLKWATNKSGPNNIPRLKEEVYNQIKTLDNFLKGIIDLFKRTLIINGITIAFSLICLPWGNFLHTVLQVLILITALGLSLGALITTLRATWITIKG